MIITINICVINKKEISVGADDRKIWELGNANDCERICKIWRKII